ncbi:MAG: trypsin-like peptidase domain-containing protein [Planctomycetota bacterium]
MKKALIGTAVFTLFLMPAFGRFQMVSGQETATAEPEVTADAEPAPETEVTNEFPEALKTRAPESIEEIKLLEEHVQQLIEKIRPATVSVSGGSGVVISEDGLILTVAHVNQRAGRRVRVTFPDGRRASAITLGNNHGVDAGMIQITDEGEWPYVETGVSEDLERGQWCLAIGFPVSYSRGNEPPVRLGRVLSSSSRTVVTDCTIMGGDSGGPLFDLDGRVIGISSRVSGSLNQNIHVPVDIYTGNKERFLEGEDWGNNRRNRALLGVRADQEASEALISEVTPGGAADEAGIEAGDVIVEFDGKPVETFEDLRDLVGDKEPDDEVKIVLKRGEETIELEVKLGSY